MCCLHKDAVNLHWTEGGTGVTNFSVEQRPIYELAIKLHGDKRLVICDEPMGRFCKTEDYASLHFILTKQDSSHDLSRFWSVFEVCKAAAILGDVIRQRGCHISAKTMEDAKFIVGQIKSRSGG